MKYLPIPAQVKTSNFILQHNHAGVLVQMGVGKTVATLTAIVWLIYNRPVVRRVLIVAPKRVARMTWPDEIEKWDHTRILSYTVLHGATKDKLLDDAHNFDVTIINYDGLMWLEKNLKRMPRYDMIVADESTFIKTPGTARTKISHTIARYIPRRVILTGSPAPRGIEDLWSQMYLLDRGRALGHTMSAFHEEYFLRWKNQHDRTEFYLKSGAKLDILRAIKPMCIVVENDGKLGLPDVVNNDILVELPKGKMKAYKELEREFLLDLDNGETLEAKSASALGQKLKQFVSGFVYHEDTVVRIHTAKLQALKELMVSLSGENILIGIQYDEEAKMIGEFLKRDIPTVNGKTSDKSSMQHLRDWNEGKLELMCVHPASVGHGLNLQESGNNLIWFGNTWSLEHYEQLIARLARRGQSEKSVFNHRILLKDTLDFKISQSLRQKDATQQSVLDFLKE